MLSAITIRAALGLNAGSHWPAAEHEATVMPGSYAISSSADVTGSPVTETLNDADCPWTTSVAPGWIEKVAEAACAVGVPTIRITTAKAHATAQTVSRTMRDELDRSFMTFQTAN